MALGLDKAWSTSWVLDLWHVLVSLEGPRKEPRQTSEGSGDFQGG